MNSKRQTLEFTWLSRHQLDGFRRLLSEETSLWQRNLHWDFSPTACALQAAIRRDKLPGLIAVNGKSAVGYIYWILHRNTSIVGSLFSKPGNAAPDVDEELLRRSMESLVGEKDVKRIEGQLLYFGQARLDKMFEQFDVKTFARCYMVSTLARSNGAPGRPISDSYRLIPYDDTMQDEAGTLIYESYIGELDSQMSQCYSSEPGCRSFVRSISRRNGIGDFDAQASLAAVTEGNELAGIILASVISPDTGHVPQISVAPAHQGKGVGRRLLLESMESFKRRGFKRVSLSVTRDNERAFNLYRAASFQTALEYPAFYWDRP